MACQDYRIPPLLKPFLLSGRNAGAPWPCMLFVAAWACAPFHGTAAQDTQPPEDKPPEINIWAAGDGYITEGEDAVFMVTADPAPVENVTVNLRVAQFRESLAPSSYGSGAGYIEEIDRSGTIQQVTIDLSGESRFIIATEDDDQNNPKYVLQVSIEPGEGYAHFGFCTQIPSLDCGYVIALQSSLTSGDSARVLVWDNDGPQSELENIAKDTRKLLESVTLNPPTAADAIELGVLSELSAAAAPDLIEGGAYSSDAFLLLRSVRMQAGILERLISAGLSVTQEQIWSTLGNAASSIESYHQTASDIVWLHDGGGRKFDAEVREVLIGSRNLFVAMVSAQDESEGIQHITAFLDEFESLIGTAYDGVLDEESQRDVASISRIALDALLQPVAAKFNLDISQESASELFSNNPDFLSKIIELSGVDLSSSKLGWRSSHNLPDSPPVVIIESGVSSRLLLFNVLLSAGLAITEAEKLSLDLSSFVHTGFTGIRVPIPDNENIGVISIGNDPNGHPLDQKFVSVSEIIDEGLGGTTETNFIDEFFVTAIRTDETVFPVQAASVKVVSDDVPEGRFDLNDGAILLIGRGLAVHLVPWSLDIASFAARASTLGFSTRARNNGSIVLSGGGTSLSATFSYSAAPMDLSGNDLPFFGVCVFAVCIDAPENTGPEQPNHSFTIGYTPAYTFFYDFFPGPVEFYDFADNRFYTAEECDAAADACKVDWQQRLLPRFASDSLYDLLASLGLEVSTDWFDTGVITIAGWGRFRPAYAFEGELPDESAIGPDDFRFEETDANGDGVSDYRVHIGDFSQLLYGVP